MRISIKKLVLPLALSAVALASSGREASAFGRVRACYYTCYTPCYYAYCYPVQPCYADGCYVYRWDPCYCCYVLDEVFPAGKPSTVPPKDAAKERLKTLKGMGVTAYAICYTTKCSVYIFDYSTGASKLYKNGLSPEEAAKEVAKETKPGFYAYSCCIQESEYIYQT